MRKPNSETIFALIKGNQLNAIYLYFLVWSGGDCRCMPDRALSSYAEPLQGAGCACYMRHTVFTRTFLCDTRELLFIYCKIASHEVVFFLFLFSLLVLVLLVLVLVLLVLLLLVIIVWSMSS